MPCRARSVSSTFKSNANPNWTYGFAEIEWRTKWDGAYKTETTTNKKITIQNQTNTQWTFSNVKKTKISHKTYDLLIFCARRRCCSLHLSSSSVCVCLSLYSVRMCSGVEFYTFYSIILAYISRLANGIVIHIFLFHFLSLALSSFFKLSFCFPFHFKQVFQDVKH